MTNLNWQTRAMLKGSAASFALGVALISAPALAQGTAEAAATADTIIVTGTRIARPDIEGAAPVTVLGQEEFQLRGAVNVEELLFTTPQIIPSLGGTTNNPGDGRALLDLRGLGTNRTLILVNGRRWVGSGPDQAVDANTIPVALVARTEVLTGGRSAVYGSDAVAGVINFVTRSDFEGFAADASYRITGRGDGGTFDANLTYGASLADGRGNVTLFLGYTSRDPIFQGARNFSRRVNSSGTPGNFTFGGSGIIPQGRLLLGGFSTGNPATNNWNVPPPAFTDYFFNPDGSFRRYAATDAYNYAPDNYLQLPQTRWLAGSFANYEFNQHLEFYGEMVYTNNRTVSELAPTPISQTLRIAVNNPFIPQSLRDLFAAMDANQARSITTQGGVIDAPNDGFVSGNVIRRVSEIGSRVSDRERQAFRVLGGFRGEISGPWRYDAYYYFARTTDLESQFGNVSLSRYRSAVAGCPVGSPTGCVPINIFGLGNISTAAGNYIKVDTKNTREIDEQVLSAAISNGELFDLGGGAGPVGLAFGVERRWVQGRFAPDFILSSGDVVGFNAGSPTLGGYNLTEVFGELNVPILGDRPGFHRLEVNGAVRYSDYSNDVGGTLTWGGTGIWAPVRDISLRGSYQRAIRAPTVNNLFLGQAQNFPAFTDYCRQAVAATNTTLRQSCINAGVPAALVGTPFGTGNTQIRAVVGGNPNLKEETADTWTAGVVITPTFAPGLSITVDYYDIRIKDGILGGGPGVSVLRDACFGTPASNFQPFNTSFCALLPRNPITFEVEDAINTAINAGSVKTRGVDFEIRYGVPVGFGLFGADDSRLQFRVAGTRLIQYDFNNLAAIPTLVNKCAGQFGLTCGDPFAKWRGNASIGWVTGPMNLNFRVNYIGPVNDDGTAGAPPFIIPRIKGYATADIAAGFDVRENLNVSFGIVNLTDRNPPELLDAQDQQANTYPSTYDVLGRRFFIRAGLKF